MSCFLTNSDGVQGQIIYRTHVPFPTETQGFFYYHPGPAHAPIAGEVRFRIVESGRPADFHAGKDLLRHSVPLPWSIPLVAMFQIANYAPFAHLVKASGLLGKDILRSLRGGAAKMPRVSKNSRIIHSLGQRIHIDAYEPRLMLAHGNALKGPFSTKPSVHGPTPKSSLPPHSSSRTLGMMTSGVHVHSGMLPPPASDRPYTGSPSCCPMPKPSLLWVGFLLQVSLRLLSTL
jgi:hypothetical protein